MLWKEKMLSPCRICYNVYAGRHKQKVKKHERLTI